LTADRLSRNATDSKMSRRVFTPVDDILNRSQLCVRVSACGKITEVKNIIPRIRVENLSDEALSYLTALREATEVGGVQPVVRRGED